MCPFGYTAVAGSGKVGPVNQVNHTNLLDVSVAIRLTVLSRYLSCRIIGHFNFQKIRLNMNALILTV